MLSVRFDSRWVGEHGIGRFADEIGRRLKLCALDISGSPTSVTDCVRLSRALAKTKGNVFSPGFNVPIFPSSRYIFTIHDLNHIDTDVGMLKKLYYQVLMKAACRKAFCVFTVSEFSRRRILEWSGVPSGKVVNVGNGVSSVFSKEGVVYSPGYSYLLCIGNRKPHKNEVRVIQAFALAAIDPAVRLLFNGDASDELIAEANLLGVQSRIVFVGRLNEEKLASVYRGATGLVFPSLYEGFGFPVVEAMACGVPVLTSNVTSLPEVAGDAALLVDPLNVQEISDGIVRLVNDDVLRTRLMNTGLERARNYCWDEVAKRVENVLHQLPREVS